MAKFQPGHKLAKGGKREGAGRKRKDHEAVELAAAVVARKFIEANVKPVLDNYLKLAQGYTETRYTAEGQAYQVFVPDGPTTRHFVDKLLPDEKHEPQPSTFNIAFVRFDNTVQVQATRVSTAILADDAERQEAGRPGVASPSGQGQNGIEFHDFKDVP